MLFCRNDLWKHLAGEAESDDTGHVRLQRTVTEQPGACLTNLGFQQPIGGGKLATDPVEPGLVAFLVRPKIVLVDDLHCLLACSECDADNPLSMAVYLAVGRHKTKRGDARRSAYSRIRLESISTTPSSVTSDGAFTIGLIAAKSSKVLKTDRGSCENGRFSIVIEIATRRT